MEESGGKYGFYGARAMAHSSLANRWGTAGYTLGRIIR
jgi:hypothetical protein